MREAVRLQPERAEFVCNLAILDQQLGDDEAAIAGSRRVLDLDVRYGQLCTAHRNIALALLSMGRPSDALTEFEEAKTYFPDHPELPIEFRMVALAPRLPAVLRGEDRPADAGERATFATLCFRSGRFAAAARLYMEALEQSPALRDD
jgi:tetratricopeptide (TPR) repeat protein